ncbi:unnamed protein product [Albugo candida]|uniref:Poly(A) RNA polymerase mitochondrial-like central palm domain-containing protein n=1 Tax=Albugo candida TaxID=65357 RepID=A0A024G0T4_9STRA|nr:unnamed protein product [Albugo candida]|eukprot:CCI39900.1 unnamed protein product [Albugo candida]
MNNAQIYMLNAELRNLTQTLGLSNIEVEQRKKIFAELRELIMTHFPSTHVNLFGSSRHGLETFRSDLDILVSNKRIESKYIYVAAEDEGEEDDEVVTFSLNVIVPSQNADLAAFRTDPSNAPLIRLVKSSAPNLASRRGSPWNHKQRHCAIEFLRELQLLIQSKREDFHIRQIFRAKVPILMLQHKKSNRSIDLGVDTENGSDELDSTSLICEFQRLYGLPFKNLVLFLKEYMHQNGLDKPYTGGIGSFRLYVMVAFILCENAASIGYKRKRCAASTDFELMMRFFAVYGNADEIHLTHETCLQMHNFKSETRCVDFHSVFRLQDCVKSFSKTYRQLRNGDRPSTILTEKSNCEHKRLDLECIKSKKRRKRRRLLVRDKSQTL